jgi:hypothetical protein
MQSGVTAVREHSMLLTNTPLLVFERGRLLHLDPT